jgi:hypothetical protein
MRSFFIYSLLLTAVSADIDHDGTCSAIDSLQDRRDTESVRAIVATVSVVVVVLPFLPLAMGANALGRKKTSDRRFQRIYDDFKGGRIELQTYIEKTCGLRVSTTYLERSCRYTVDHRDCMWLYRTRMFDYVHADVLLQA